MAQKFRFRNFKVYNDAIDFRSKIKELVRKYFQKEEKYILVDQIIRAVNSIILNIAEGSDRGTDKDFALFLNRAHTSLCEVVSCLDIALSDGYISQSIYDEYVIKSTNLSDQITAFRRKLLTSPQK